MTDETGMKEIIVEGEYEREIKTERLYGGFQIRKLRMIPQDDWQMYMINPKTGRSCYQPRPQDQYLVNNYEHKFPQKRCQYI
jgi:hypothetical protein